MKIKDLFLCIVLTIVSCTTTIPDKLLDEGVSCELAQFRKENYTDIRYLLGFSIPENKQDSINAFVYIYLTLEEPTPIILDFTGNAGGIQKLTINHRPVKYTVENQHIIIPGKDTSPGSNVVTINFKANDQSLNRRDDFVYTLLVPDRARTLFPCFDQPNLKAEFELCLEVPDTWEAIGNESKIYTYIFPGDSKLMRFYRTRPISTYLFSFVAGKFDKVNKKKAGRTITLYHRETDLAKTAQCDAILDEVFQSLEWMEEYTGINYPFGKYDLILLPGFQYGGMEHMGATLYNDRRMFLEPNATSADSLGRSSLIAHETAHMWFGDYVTMEWFSDVWNKEVFANWFAVQIVGPMYPHIDHRLNFMTSYYPPAYSEDRTGGAMPIQQPLDNLRNAGLIYSNVVYNKSPIVMEMLIEKIGTDNFCEAIREYLHQYAYGNSDWDGLIKILNGKTQENLYTWSNNWVKEKGMPTISFERDSGKLNIKKTDPWNKGRWWPADVQFDIYSTATGYKTHTVKMTGSKTKGITIPEEEYIVLPNRDGRGYGYFKADPKSTEWLLENWGKIDQDVSRFSMLMNLYEGMMHLDVKPEAFLESMIRCMDTEANPQIFRQALAYIEACTKLFVKPDHELHEKLEDYLFRLASEHATPSYRTLALKSFGRLASSKISLERLYQIWDIPAGATKFRANENDLIEFSYILALHHPDRADEILQKQLSRITNPDRRKEYEFVMQALAPSQQQRREFFDRLLQPESWAVEPWAQAALRWLNHPARYPESLAYIRPALDVLREVQRKGDIFFPVNWCSSLLSGHTSPEALDIVKTFFADNPDYPKLLESKIRQRADHLYIVNNF